MRVLIFTLLASLVLGYARKSQVAENARLRKETQVLLKLLESASSESQVGAKESEDPAYCADPDSTCDNGYYKKFCPIKCGDAGSSDKNSNDHLNEIEDFDQSTLKKVAYTSSGTGGKCRTRAGADPSYEYYGNEPNCEERCTDSATCYGYSMSSYQNCLLWTQSDIMGGGDSWSGAGCHIKNVDDASAKVISCSSEITGTTTADHIEVKYPFTAEQNSYIFDACASDFDTILYIADSKGEIVTGNDDHDGTCTGSNDSASYLDAQLKAGEKYELILTGYGDNNHGSFTIASTCASDAKSVWTETYEVVGLSNHITNLFAIIGAISLVYYGANVVHKRYIRSSGFTEIEAEC